MTFSLDSKKPDLQNSIRGIWLKLLLIPIILLFSCDKNRKEDIPKSSKKNFFIIKEHDELPVKRGLYADHYPLLMKEELIYL